MPELELYDRDGSFWEIYNKGRAKVPDSFFERLHTYHSAHGGAFDTINDIGAGVGWLSQRLSSSFKKVILTEPASQTLDAAKRILGDSDGKYSFVNATAEQDSQAAGSVDAVFVCNALHFMVVDVFARSAARQLKSKGTLFASLFAFPHFKDPDVHRAWIAMIDEFVQRFLLVCGEARARAVLSIQDNGCDALALPDDLYEPGALRVRLNARGDPLAFTQSPLASRQLQIPRFSRAGPRDEYRFETDEDWDFEATPDDIEALVNSYPFEPEAERLRHHMAIITELASKHGGVCSGHWPVDILMATRR